MTPAAEVDGLRYLDASHVEHPAGMLAGVEVCTETGESLGSVEGVLVEPSRRRVRYFVVERAAMLRPRQYLLPADDLVTLDREDGKLHVDCTAGSMERFDAGSVRVFSDDDTIEAMFAPAHLHF